MIERSTDSSEAFEVNEFCQRHGISRDTFYKEIRRGRLVARKIGKKTIVTRADAARWLENLPALDLSGAA